MTVALASFVHLRRGEKQGSIPFCWGMSQNKTWGSSTCGMVVDIKLRLWLLISERAALKPGTKMEVCGGRQGTLHCSQRPSSRQAERVCTATSSTWERSYDLQLSFSFLWFRYHGGYVNVFVGGLFETRRSWGTRLQAGGRTKRELQTSLRPLPQLPARADQRGISVLPRFGAQNWRSRPTRSSSRSCVSLGSPKRQSCLLDLWREKQHPNLERCFLFCMTAGTFCLGWYSSVFKCFLDVHYLPMHIHASFCSKTLELGTSSKILRRWLSFGKNKTVVY